jgi:hypothetical protein
MRRVRAKIINVESTPSLKNSSISEYNLSNKKENGPKRESQTYKGA